MFKLRMYVLCITKTQSGHGWKELYKGIIKLAIDHPRGNFVDYYFLILHELNKPQNEICQHSQSGSVNV